LLLFLSDINISNKVMESISYPVRYISLAYDGCYPQENGKTGGRRYRRTTTSD
jgi:hypothetical protein